MGNKKQKMTEKERAIRKAEKHRLEMIQHEKDRLAGELRDLREKYVINEPAILWKVGKRVILGAITETRVLAVLDGGKILKVHCWSVASKNTKNPGAVSEDERYISWHDIEKYKTEDENSKIKSFIEEEDINVQYSQRDMYGLVLMYYHFGIDMDMEYQRGHVWDLEDKIKLLDSIFKNVDIGKITMIHRDFGAEKLYEMLDGKQRLTAIIEFIERRYKYHGMAFDDLCFRDQNHIMHYHISMGEISIRNIRGNLTDEQKYRFFLKLNTGGKPQDPAHINYVKGLWEKSKGEI